MRTEYKNWIMLFVLLCVVVAGLFGISGKLAGDRQKEGERREVWAVSKEKSAESGGTKGTLKLYAGKLSGRATAFHWETAGDQRVLSLLYQKVSDLAEVTWKKKGKGAVYQIHLKKNVMDSDGKLVTADTLLYNYYIRCQTGYQGDDAIDGVSIRGLCSYRYGVTGEKLKQRMKKVRQAIRKPDKKLRQQVVTELVTPVLYKEYYWVKTLYYNKSAQKLCERYPEPVQLFAYYYAPNTSYTGKGRNGKQAVQDIAKQYGTDLEHLEEMTGTDYEAKLQGLAIQYFWPGRAVGGGKIQGIQKLDDQTIQIETTKYRENDRKKLQNIYVVTRRISKDVSGEKESEIKIGKSAGSLPVGTGAYILQKKENNSLCLQVNSYYDREAVNPTQIVIQNGDLTAGQCIRSVCDGTLDMACIWERAEYEKTQISRTMKKGDALWESALLGGLVYHPGRVNATTISREAVDAENLGAIVKGLEMNDVE